MASTLHESLTSLLSQLDERFEVIVVDDGSNDESISVISSLAQAHTALRFIALPRDKKRKLGFTRNISIQEARGSYVMLHLDCDDIFGPYLTDFVEVFHRLEKCMGRDILLSGQHVNMARRDFLLSHGPYLNMYRGEDRHLWSRLAAIDAYIPLDHIDFIIRLPKPISLRFTKMLWDQYDHMRNDFRSGITFRRYFLYEMQKSAERTFKYQAFRYLMLFPTWLISRFDEPISQVGTIGSPEAFAAYRDKTRGSYSELMRRCGGDPDISFLRPEARYIFLEQPSSAELRLQPMDLTDHQVCTTIRSPLRPTWARYFNLFWARRSLSVHRALQYEMLERVDLHGYILDIGGGTRAHYKSIIDRSESVTGYDSINLDSRMEPTYTADFSKPFELPQRTYDMVISMNTFEHLRRPEEVLRRLPAVLMPGGRLLIVVPFLIRVHASPYDYVRLTASWWTETLAECGFDNIVVEPLVWDPISSAAAIVAEVGPLRLMRRLLAPLYGLIFSAISAKDGERYEAKVGEKIAEFALGYQVEARLRTLPLASDSKNEMNC
jgi:glycosyltransferase involved in cell wall biosynthesis